MKTLKYCRHCRQIVTCRAGRGLCRSCWDRKDIREKYPVLSQFGGKTFRGEQNATTVPENAKNEVIPKVGDSFEMSDHQKVRLPILRNGANMLTVDLQDGYTLIITSETAIKVEEESPS